MKPKHPMAPSIKEEVNVQKNYVEIGPNLRAVLERMIYKVEISHSEIYLNVAFSPICQLIERLLQERKQTDQTSGDFAL